jgi:hypothetical protein
MEKLDRLSLISFVTIHNSFRGLYMTRQLRVWCCSAEIRIAEHREVFTSPYEHSISEAIGFVYSRVVDYVRASPSLGIYWSDKEE